MLASGGAELVQPQAVWVGFTVARLPPEPPGSKAAASKAKLPYAKLPYAKLPYKELKLFLGHANATSSITRGLPHGD